MPVGQTSTNPWENIFSGYSPFGAGYDLKGNYNPNDPAWGLGSVLGANTGPNGGTPPAPAPSPDSGIPLQGAPAQQEPDWGAIFQPGFDSLNQYQSTLQPQYNTMVSGIENQSGQQKTNVEAERARRMGEYGNQRSAAEQKAGGTIAESRRLASQLMQGIQSRYGGSTNVGGAASEILGSQATSNIAQNRAALQQTNAQIAAAEDQVKTWATNSITKIDQDTDQAKQQALNWFNQALADVNSQRNTLETAKAQKRAEYLQQYYGQLNQIEASNTAFKQQLFAQHQSYQDQINAYKQTALGQYGVNTTQANYANPYGNAGQAQVATNQGVRYIPQGGQNSDQDWWNQYMSGYVSPAISGAVNF